MKISQGLLLSGLIVFGMAHADDNTDNVTAVVQKTMFQNFTSSLATKADAVAAKLWIAAAIQKLSSCFDENGRIGDFLNNNQAGINRAVVALGTAAVVAGLYKAYEAYYSEQNDINVDEYFDMFDIEDDFDNDVDYNDEDEVVENN